MGGRHSPRTVVFDLGGVLIDWDPRHLYRKMFDDDGAMERFLADICNTEWNLQMDRGLPFEEGVANLCRQHPDMTPYIEAFWNRWPEMITGAIDGTVKILETLHASRVPVYALSNWSAQTWPFARDRFKFLELFDDMVISGFEGTMKPETAIFEILRNRHAIDPAETIFIDDRADNIAVAKSLGFDGILFTNPAALSRELTARDLL